MEEAHVERGRAGDLDPDHLLRLPFLPDLLHDLARDPGAADLGPRLDPHGRVPQAPELGRGERQLRHPRGRPRGARRGLGRRHRALPREPRVPERPPLLLLPGVGGGVGVEPAARVGEHAVVGAEHVLDGPPRRARRRGRRGRLRGEAGALEAAEDEGHGGAARGAAGADGVLVVGVGGGRGLRAEVERGGRRAEAAAPAGAGPGGEPRVGGGGRGGGGGGGGGGEGAGGEEEEAEVRGRRGGRQGRSGHG